jgi:hypothetical protein
VALLINTTLTNLELGIPYHESEAAVLVAPVFLALGMNKALKNLKIVHYPPSAVPVYLAVRDGLEKNSTLEMLDICTLLKNFPAPFYPNFYLFFASVRPSNV